MIGICQCFVQISRASFKGIEGSVLGIRSSEENEG